MDYEKKYKEAVGILEFLIGLETVQESGTIPVKDIINTFPELKNHNDERIRKSLISVFTTHKKDEMYYGTSVDEILEWLDRQGEQKPTDKDKPKFKVGDKIIRKELGGDFIHNPHIIIQVDMLDKKYRLKDGLVAHFSEEDDWELVEQKPAWSEEDETVLNNLIYALANDRIGNDRDEYISYLKSLKDRNTWKPSDEQMDALKGALYDAIWQYDFKGSPIKEEVTRRHAETIESLYNDLKKLRRNKL